jgi:hypothetical protein
MYAQHAGSLYGTPCHHAVYGINGRWRHVAPRWPATITVENVAQKNRFRDFLIGPPREYQYFPFVPNICSLDLRGRTRTL